MFPGFFLLSGIVTGILWTAVYILVIRQGFRDRTFGIPFVALCANIAWEFTFAFVFPHRMPQLAINYAWFGLDVVILIQLIRAWRREFATWTAPQFWSTLLLSLAAALAAIVAITLEFDDFNGMYAAFGQNWLMSILFITMLHHRGDRRGQSVAIALCKMGGTLASSAGFWSIGAGSGYLLPFLYVAILVTDLIYLGLLLRVPRSSAE